MEQLKLRTLVTDAIRFWEPLRLVYNVFLLLILLYFVVAKNAWAVFGSSEFLANCVVLAVMANIAYSFAYIPDLLLRFSLLSGGAKRFGRWLIFAIGMVISYIFCSYIADELVRAYAWVK